MSLKEQYNLPTPIRLPRAEQIVPRQRNCRCVLCWLESIIGRRNAELLSGEFCSAYRRASGMEGPHWVINERMDQAQQLDCMVKALEDFGYRPMTPAQVREGRRKK